jgi:hypothetical protein
MQAPRNPVWLAIFHTAALPFVLSCSGGSGGTQRDVAGSMALTEEAFTALSTLNPTTLEAASSAFTTAVSKDSSNGLARLGLASTQLATLGLETGDGQPIGEFLSASNISLGSWTPIDWYTMQVPPPRWDPTSLPNNSPGGEQLRELLVDHVIPRVEQSIQTLKLVPLSYSGEANYDGVPFEFDGPDARLIEAHLRLWVAGLHLATALDWSISIRAAVEARAQGAPYRILSTGDPNNPLQDAPCWDGRTGLLNDLSNTEADDLLYPAADASSRLQAARTHLRLAIDAFDAGMLSVDEDSGLELLFVDDSQRSEYAGVRPWVVSVRARIASGSGIVQEFTAPSGTTLPGFRMDSRVFLPSTYASRPFMPWRDDDECDWVSAEQFGHGTVGPLADVVANITGEPLSETMLLSCWLALDEAWERLQSPTD